MSNLKSISAHVVAIVILLVYLNSCKTKSRNYNPKRDDRQPSMPMQSTHQTTTVNRLDKSIRSIFQDVNGNFWFGTNTAGVYRYDGNTLTQFTMKDGLVDNQITTIQADQFGNIWFGTGGFGISRFDGSKFTIHTRKVNIKSGKAAEWKSRHGDLWFYAGGGVFRYSKPSMDYLPFDSLGANPDANSPFSLNRFGVYAILKDTRGNVWFGTQAEGVCKYDGKSLTWFKEKGLSGPAVLGLFEDSKGNLWFGNNGAGLFRYDGKTLTNFTEEKGLSNADFRASGKPGLGTLARVYAINEDNAGNIWVGTVDAGVWKYDGNSLTNYTTSNGLTSNAVNTIYKDKSGKLWFGTDNNGICNFNGTKFTEFIIE
jgi:ligand-binding sensor domain-containing protein